MRVLVIDSGINIFYMTGTKTALAEILGRVVQTGIKLDMPGFVRTQI